MSSDGALRIALFTHSTNPRGGVVHALEVGEALHDLGHKVVVHAPDTGGGFFRKVRCGVALVPAAPAKDGVDSMVRQRIAEYVRFLKRSRPTYDIYHAQDGISANALAELAAQNRIRGYLRTIHHLDKFQSPYLRDCQDRSVLTADRCFCVSKTWQTIVKREFGIEPAEAPNGVNTRKFTPGAVAADDEVAARIGIAEGPVFLAVGGIELRKNTVGTLRAFLSILPECPAAQLVVVGGASLLDHAAYRREFQSLLESSGAAAGRVILAGVVEDRDMPALFRLADALVFPSFKEGFGLVVLEAMASGTPVICPGEPPFTEYLNRGDAVFVTPSDTSSIADAMRYVLDGGAAASLRIAGLAVSRRFTWRASAEAHLRHYHAWLDSHDRSPDAGDAISSAVAG